MAHLSHFLLCALMTVVVHSFVADSSLLDCCDLVVFLCACFFHLMLAGRQPFGVLRWFQLFCFFYLVSAVCLPDESSHFSFATSICGLVFLCHRHLRSVLSFFATGICVQSLSFTAFSAVGLRVRLFVSALLALVSGYHLSLSFWYHAVRLLLVSFILGDSNWNFFQVGYPVDSPTNSTLKQTPFGILP